MPTKTQVDLLTEDYQAALEDFKQARDKVTKAKQKLLAATGHAISPELREQQRQASRRYSVLRANPVFLKFKGKARRQAIDNFLAKRDAPRVWTFYLDTMEHDPETRAPKVRGSNRKRYELYRAGLTLAAQLWRAQAQTAVPSRAVELVDKARKIELHLQSLVDVAPRQVWVNYPGEWAVVSEALRPEGSSPKGKGAKRLLGLYQYIIRTHKVEP